MSQDNSSKKVNILHVTTVDIGGAYKAVERLVLATAKYDDINTSILLRNKLMPDSNGTVFLDSIVKRLGSKIKNAINLKWMHGDISGDRLGSDITGHELFKQADIVVIHWINSFLAPSSIEKIIDSGKQVVIMLHDMWHFTGGCPCDGYCEGYTRDCSNCPRLEKGNADEAAANLIRKTAIYKDRKVTVVSPSNWILEHAMLSPVFKGQDIRRIFNCIDNDFYHPMEKEAAKKEMGVVTDKPVVMFASVKGGSKNPNKGFNYLLDAIDKLGEDEVHLLILGDIDDESLARIKQSYTLYGYIMEERMMAVAYNAADVTVVPSLQESFSYSVCESLSCGTPVTAFPIGGILDQITHEKNGYFAKFKDGSSLADGIRFCIENHDRLSAEAIQGARRFSYDNIGKEWHDLYMALVEK